MNELMHFLVNTFSMQLLAI